MKKTRKICWVVFAICLSTPVVLAQKVGSTSMQFLEVMPVARATALGDAYSVWASGADAVFWNPSGVALVQGQEFSSTFVKWIFDTRQGALSYATSVGEIGAIGVQIQYVDFGEFLEAVATRPYINKETDPGLTGNTFHPYSYLVGVTYARSLTDRFSTGVTVKYAHESLYNGQMIMTQVSQGVNEEVKTWANGIMFDFGIRYNTGFRSIQIGASVQNFGGNVTYAKQSSPVPLLFRWGIAADIVGKDALVSFDETNRLGLSFDLYQPNDYGQQEHVGAEYEYAGVLALRAGYKFNYDFEGLTIGGGIKQAIGFVQFSLDYSYGSVGTYLGSVHRIGLGARIQ
jgi:Type IX secretion system protein PorV